MIHINVLIRACCPLFPHLIKASKKENERENEREREREKLESVRESVEKNDTRVSVPSHTLGESEGKKGRERACLTEKTASWLPFRKASGKSFRNKCFYFVLGPFKNKPSCPK